MKVPQKIIIIIIIRENTATIADKLLESLMFKYLFNHLRDNNLLSLQSGFIPGDSTINQLTFLYNILPGT